MPRRRTGEGNSSIQHEFNQTFAVFYHCRRRSVRFVSGSKLVSSGLSPTIPMRYCLCRFRSGLTEAQCHPVPRGAHRLERQPAYPQLHRSLGRVGRGWGILSTGPWPPLRGARCYRCQSGSKLPASLAWPQRQSDPAYTRSPCEITIDSPD